MGKIRNQMLACLLVAGLGVLSLPVRAVGEDKGITALQQSVSLLMSQVADLQKGFNTQVEVIKSLVSQNTDTVNQLSSSLKSIQQAISGSQVIASQQQNDVSKQFQALADTLSELQAHLQRMDDTLKQVQQMQQTIPSPAPAATVGAPGTETGGAPGTGMAPAAAAAASPLQLYQNALSDFQTNSPMAQGELASFIRNYPNDPQVPDATYYLGTIYLQKQQYNEAIDRFSDLIEQYPNNPKTPLAELNKGVALAKQGNKTAAISELRALAKNYPGTEAARQADIELKGMSSGRGAR